MKPGFIGFFPNQPDPLYQQDNRDQQRTQIDLVEKAPVEPPISNFTNKLNTAALSLGGSLNNYFPQFTPGSLTDEFVVDSSAQKARDFLNKKIDKEIVIKRIEPNNDNERLGGYFKSSGPGGPSDPSQRALYLRPKTDLETLFHEAGHAGDPMLRDKPDFRYEEIQRLRTPTERLNYLFERTGKPVVKAETEAQSFVARNLPGFLKQNPEIQSNYKDHVGHSWFKEYPASYATKSIEDFYQAELPPTQFQPVVEEDADRGVATRVFPSDSQKALRYALDSSLKEKEKEIKDFTRSYIDARLNQFQGEPTPYFEGFFSPKK